MLITKSISLGRVLSWTWYHVLWLLLFMGSVAALYHYDLVPIAIPWLPVSVIGTAVAFYVGFKNNQAYDRMWEARKIWGAIVNSSRSWGMQVDGFLTNQFASEPVGVEELHGIKRSLIYRHIVWLYALRNQLLKPTPWEHINQGGRTEAVARYYQQRYGIGLVEEDLSNIDWKTLIDPEEKALLKLKKNAATQIINQQSRELTKLRERGLIEDFRHMEMMKTLSDFYVHQGKCERIKKFPLPRQYANMSRIFVGIFIFLLPFSMVPELAQMGSLGFWASIPIAALVGWVYVMMEVVGDYSENPFQGMANDIPMLSLTRTIELDLREMLGETDLPPAIEARRGILM